MTAGICNEQRVCLLAMAAYRLVQVPTVKYYAMLTAFSQI